MENRGHPIRLKKVNMYLYLSSSLLAKKDTEFIIRREVNVKIPSSVRASNNTIWPELKITVFCVVSVFISILYISYYVLPAAAIDLCQSSHFGITVVPFDTRVLLHSGQLESSCCFCAR